MTTSEILIVEDEFVVAAHIEACLTSLGYTVVDIADERDQAIALAQELRPDLVLMDIHLASGPMTGIEAAAEITGRFGIPIIYLTAHSDPYTLERAKKTEPHGYLLKPFAERELFSAIETALFKANLERRLHERTEWLTTALRSIGEGVIATDERGLVKMINRVAEELLGVPQDAAIGRPLDQLLRAVRAGDRAPLRGLAERVLATEAPASFPRECLLRVPGAERQIAARGAPIHDTRGRVSGVVVVFRDVTAERRAEAQLQMVERLKSVGVLAGGIAHDFNNMLSGIMMHASLGRLRAHDRKAAAAIFEKIEESCDRARRLTRQLLTFSSGGAPVRQSSSLEPIARSSAEFALRGRSARLLVCADPGLWPAKVDAGQIGQVITNLVLNADAAMPGGGEVRVSLSNHTSAADDELSAGRYVVIAVSDSGVGIPEDAIGRVFEPYFTTRESGQGLGLASSYSIVRAHAGALRVESTQGVGSTFRVFLPASVDAPAEHDPAGGSALPSGDGRRILVMDDDQTIAEGTTAILEALGYRVVSCGDGHTALACYAEARRMGDGFGLVIADLTVPGGGGGLEMLRRMKVLFPEARVIASSGYADGPVMSDHAALGFVDVLAKPYSLNQLADVVASNLPS